MKRQKKNKNSKHSETIGLSQKCEFHKKKKKQTKENKTKNKERVLEHSCQLNAIS